MLALELDHELARTEIEDGLRRKTLVELRTMARNYGIPLKIKTKEEAVSLLAAALTDPNQINARLASLSKEDRLILDIIQLTGEPSGSTFQRFQATMKGVGLTAEPKSTAVTLSELAEQGLIVWTGDNRWSTSSPIKLPKVVSAVLSAQPIPFLIKPQAPKREELTFKVPPNLVDDELHFVWRYLEENPVTLVPPGERDPFEEREGLKGWHNSSEEVGQLTWHPSNMNVTGFSMQVLPTPSPLPEPSFKALSDKVVGGESKVQLLFQLLQSLGLIETKVRVVVCPDKMQKFLTQPRIERLKTVVKAWLGLGIWSETFLLSSCPADIQVRRLVGQRPLNRQEFFGLLTDGQRFVVNALARLETDTWYSKADFLEVLRVLSPDFLVRPWFRTWDKVPWWFQSTVDAKVLDPHNRLDWLNGEGIYVSSLLEGPLFWLGLVELAYAEDQLEAFRTTPYARLLVGRLPAVPSSESGNCFEIGTDLTVAISPGAADGEAHALMKRLGILVEATPKRFRYQLAADRVARAFEDGLVVSDIVDFFQSRGVSLPATVAHTLQDWWERFGLVRLYEKLTVVEFADDYVLKELRAATSIDRHIIYEFSPRLVAVLPDSVDTLIAEMTRKGQMPKLVEGEV